MIKILSQNNKSAYNLITYMADTNEDFQQIDKTKLPMGTECYVIEDQKWYILNSNKEWKNYGENKESGESNIQIEELNITENGIYTAPEDVAYSPVNVNIPIPPEINIETLNIVENGIYTAPEETAYNLISVAVPIPPEINVESLQISENGVYTAPSGKAYNSITVNIPDNIKIFDSTSGSFTLATPLSVQQQIQHGLGKTPDMVMVFTKTDVVAERNCYVGGVLLKGSNMSNGASYYIETGGHSHTPKAENSGSGGVRSMDQTGFNIGGSANYPFISGVECVWYAFAFK